MGPSQSAMQDDCMAGALPLGTILGVISRGNTPRNVNFGAAGSDFDGRWHCTSTALALQCHCAGTGLVLSWYRTDTILVPHSYCVVLRWRFTVAILVLGWYFAGSILVRHSYCAGTALAPHW